MTKLKLIEYLSIFLILLPACMALNSDSEKWEKRFNYIAFVMTATWLAWLTHIVFDFHLK